MFLKIIVIIAATSFVLLVFGKAIYNHMQGKCNCPDCEGSCSTCNGNCKNYSKEELKKHLEETYLK
ncbi:MAG: hypothetical protein K6E87_05480 [bacterium]|nr:hypothetical protein [bacterium]